MKTSELTGAALDWAVAKCEGAYTQSVDTDIDGTIRINYGGMYPEWSTDWAQGGPIIEQERLLIQPEIGKEGMGNAWYAVSMKDTDSYGPTPLIAAMRCYVASKLGDDVTLPPELEQTA